MNINIQMWFVCEFSGERFLSHPYNLFTCTLFPNSVTFCFFCQRFGLLWNKILRLNIKIIRKLFQIFFFFSFSISVEMVFVASLGIFQVREYLFSIAYYHKNKHYIYHFFFFFYAIRYFQSSIPASLHHRLRYDRKTTSGCV